MSYHVPSVAAAAKVLKLLSRYRHSNSSLTEIAEALHLNKTTCLRVLRTLEQEDFLCYDPDTRKYRLGPYLIALGNRAAEMGDVVSAAIAELPRVAEDVGLTVVLVQRLQNQRLIYIASAAPNNEEVRIEVSVGQQFPESRGAFGQCFAAFETELESARRTEERPDRPDPPHSQRSSRSSESHLRHIREIGYAVSHGELMPGFSSIAVPIFNRRRQVELVVACLAVSSQLSPEVVTKTANILLDASGRLSRWYGFDRSDRTVEGHSARVVEGTL
ncbi:MAG: IclR family transcriptional regulator [Alicyclobacillaceae bacterium]|nr:IclR family transcriptional regulator [Alicyclobacillaceae bacterium]